jgi:hypothetical protein
MLSPIRRITLVLLMLLVADIASLHAQHNSDQVERQRQYGRAIRPILQRYCFKCHAGDRTEADVDLSYFSTIATWKARVKVWQQVAHMLDSQQMPPKGSKQPSETERRQLRQWVEDFLKAEAVARAGDPGPVVLRRLSNTQYTYTLRDLTGIPTLNPAEEFPVDGAAGEGFTNTGNALVMSPSLVTKYLDAAKVVADQIVLLPDGIRFSEHTTQRDWTDEALGKIRQFYYRHTVSGGGKAVDLQGIKFNTNEGGQLALIDYLLAILEERDVLLGGDKRVAQIALERGLSRRYLATLVDVMRHDNKKSLLLSGLQKRLREAAPQDATDIAASIAAWQKALWKFNAVGQLGREGGPQSWMEAVTPTSQRQVIRLPIPASKSELITVYLANGDAGDGNQHDYVIWERPRIEFKDRPPILLRDVRSLVRRIERVRAAEGERVAEYLVAVKELYSSKKKLREVAKAMSLNPALLEHWTDYLALGHRRTPQIAGHFRNKLQRVHGYQDVNGWGQDGTPSLLTNRSDEPISFLTLTVPARGVTVHPSPTQESIVAWRSPMDGQVRVVGLVADSDNKCGNGASWRLEHVSQFGKQVLLHGVIDNGGKQPFQGDQAFQVEKGDLLQLIVTARDQDHSCDTTQLKWEIIEVHGKSRKWDLADQIIDNILTSNPLTDSYGNQGTWHFCASQNQSETPTTVPVGSILARWRDAVRDGGSPDEIVRLANVTQQLLLDGKPTNAGDKELKTQLSNWNGPLAWRLLASRLPLDPSDQSGSEGIDAARFGTHPNGSMIEPNDLCVQAPTNVEVQLPVQLVRGGELVSAVRLHTASAGRGCAQAKIVVHASEFAGPWPDAPLLVVQNGVGQRQVEQACREFRELFPAALCYTRVVPVDEVVTLTLFHREDGQLQRLILEEDEIRELDRLWDELWFISHEPLRSVVAFEQISEFATQDRPDLVIAFKPLRKKIDDRADQFRQRLIDTRPRHVEAIVDFAELAWRRPLTPSEQEALRGLYGRLRKADLAHGTAIRLTAARILTSPVFLYRLERASPGIKATPVSGTELANRLSYFLWASMPDRELQQLATKAILTDRKVLVAQLRRMLRDPRSARLAEEFSCQWLGIRDFDENDGKNEQLYPEFSTLRGAMYRESVMFFSELFRNDGSVLDILNADYTFVNRELAAHYGLLWPSHDDDTGSKSTGDEWLRLDGIRRRGRGGILAMSTVLATNSGASRTSPILRGNWVSETLLGERLPRPPANVPQLPEAVPSGLTARQLIEQHSSVPECAKCHAKIDPYGFALEQYDALGRLREMEVDTKTTLVDGRAIDGMNGLREYLTTVRHDDFIRQFCRKLLGYALGRAVQLSDEILLDEMQQRLIANDYRFSVAVESIVTSPQFLMIRGADWDEGE